MPKGIEIERKFLLESRPPDLSEHPSSELEQGYVALGADGTEVRVRRDGDRHFLTIKSSGAGARVEEEIEIDSRRFESLWQLTSGRRIEKTRYRIPAPEGATIEVDVYHGSLEGLLTAEVEFESAESAEAFMPPEWMGRDVTDDGRYKNQRLATQGAPRY